MRWKNKNSMLIAGVRASRGHPDHFENDEDFALTEFDGGSVIALHTPRETVKRVHELMHANHTLPHEYAKAYKGVIDTFAQITEDAWIHANHWPWKADYYFASSKTPKPIKEATVAYIADELAIANKKREEMAKAPGSGFLLWPEFATRFRAFAVLIGLYGDWSKALDEVKFDKAQRDFAVEMMKLLTNKKTKRRRRYSSTPGKSKSSVVNRRKVAQTFEQLFSPPKITPPRQNGFLDEEYEPEGYFGKAPPMEIVELPLSVSIDQAEQGWKMGRTGTRVIRSAVMRPIPSQYPFLRRMPIVPGGTILVDASGSMGDWDNVKKWCVEAPQATVAYYAGGHGEGWLYIYAMNGYRAADIRKPDGGGNTVDGRAIDWLLSQPAPRIMITDRQFCGSPDSDLQVMRLANLEKEGEIEVREYRNKRE